MDNTAAVHAFLAAQAAGGARAADVLSHPWGVAWLWEVEAMLRLQRAPRPGVAPRVRFAVAAPRSRVWRALEHAPTQVVPGASVKVVGGSGAILLVLGVRRTPFQVVLTTFLHVTSGTLLATFTGLQSRSIGAGASVTCTTALVPFVDETKALWGVAAAAAVPSSARVHSGMLALSRHFTHSQTFAALTRATRHPLVRRVLVAGFSLGGAMTHLCGSLLREFMVRAVPKLPLLLLAEGAPRTGDAVWAMSMAAPTALFAHAHFVSGEAVQEPAAASAAPPATRNIRVHVDEVVTMPLFAMGYTTCAPLIVVVDGAMAFESRTLLMRDLWNMRSHWSLCLGSLNFLRGFSPCHRPTLLLPRHRQEEEEENEMQKAARREVVPNATILARAQSTDA